MTETNFTQVRADEIAASVNQDDVAVFTSAVAFAPGVVPTAEAVASVAFPADFSIDASTFSGNGSRGTATASAGGEQVALALIDQDGVWKLDSTGSSENITEARAGA
ncbi:hypothetical protein J2Y69_002609 [Microbacterium resistens]|uniref:Uncharacterized protein n=1 Tax=Microbacterium resistens TaxID=156977 RepID=A0ABU1SEG3_9MICO|nr:hypothetical protein [Microbacterium resistens]MDR6868001.1 hypothetical protein [Microbacterium resistens]